MSKIPTILLLFIPFILLSQELDTRSVNIKKSQTTIKVDGELTSEEWAGNEIATNLWMKFPVIDRKADAKTEVQFTYDDKNFYVGFKVYASSKDIIVSSLKRDIGLREGDGVGIALDPINQKANGFYFSVSPYNSQTDGLIGSEDDDISFTWDNKWYSETKVYEDYWTAEFQIPFSILRYEDNKQVWGLQIIRSNRIKNEFHTWTQVPLQFRGFDLGYHGQLIWDAPPPRAGKNFSLNPYVLSQVLSSKEDNIPTKLTANTGVDAKIGLSSSMNLDLTVNPDFSNVDVDRQVTNLTRFNIFFPERRVFFLENDDLFSSFGIPPIRPFYSRRIGSKDGQNVPILFGARLTGNISKNARIGLMNVQTGRKGKSAADNFTTFVFNQRVLSRSQIKGYFSNRSAFMTAEEKLNKPFAQFGRNGGIELLYSNKEGTINGWGGYHLSFKPNTKGNNTWGSIGGGYFGTTFSSFIDYNFIERNYYADMGFVNRLDLYDAENNKVYRQGTSFFYNETEYRWNMDERSTFNRIELSTENFLAYDEKNKFNELTIEPSLEFNFKTTQKFAINASYNEVNLLYPFKFISDAPKALEARKYNFLNYGVEYSSDARKNITYTAKLNYGRFYTADYAQAVIGFTARNQPYLSVGINFEYNNLEFSQEYGGQEEFLLIAPRIEWNFSNAIFWTSFLQYNTQADNFNINSRLQWRYRPMSDLFLVYSDDYFTVNGLSNKSRGFVLKVNYWI